VRRARKSGWYKHGFISMTDTTCPLSFHASFKFIFVKWPEQEADHSPSMNNEVNNEWNCNLTPLVCPSWHVGGQLCLLVYICQRIKISQK
jgi:hypothetical protein